MEQAQVVDEPLWMGLLQAISEKALDAPGSAHGNVDHYADCFAHLKLKSTVLWNRLLELVPVEFKDNEMLHVCSMLGKAMMRANIDQPVLWLSLLDKLAAPPVASPGSYQRLANVWVCNGMKSAHGWAALFHHVACRSGLSKDESAGVTADVWGAIFALREGHDVLWSIRNAMGVDQLKSTLRAVSKLRPDLSKFYERFIRKVDEMEFGEYQYRYSDSDSGLPPSDTNTDSDTDVLSDPDAPSDTHAEAIGVRPIIRYRNMDSSRDTDSSSDVEGIWMGFHRDTKSSSNTDTSADDVNTREAHP